MKRLGWLLLVLLLLPNAAFAQSRPPLVEYTPAEWSWWCGGDTCILLPQASGVGPQGRFMLVSPGQRTGDYLSAFMGGGEIIWQGGMVTPVVTPVNTWDAVLVTGNGARGLCAESTDQAWTVCAISSAWSADARVYNTVLKGGAE